MTKGRLTVIAIVLITAIFGVGLWWAQTRAYYVELDNVGLIVQRGDGTNFVVDLDPVANAVRGIDAETSPLRFRACFTLTPEQTAEVLAEAFDYDDPTPLIAPDWFDCYDAETLGPDIETGAAQAFLVQRDIRRGVDRVAALYPDGRGFAWHQLNGTLE